MMATSNPYTSHQNNPAAYYRAAEHSSYAELRGTPQHGEHHYRTHNAAVPSRHWADRFVGAEPLATSTAATGVASTSASVTEAAHNAYPVMTATGKKRKRLQRACVSCHKAKRRCDGGLPCSNCDFSGRTCAYSDSQGKAVPPTKRSLRPSEAASLQQQQHQQQQQAQFVAPMHHPSPSVQSSSIPGYRQPAYLPPQPRQLSRPSGLYQSSTDCPAMVSTVSDAPPREPSRSPRSSNASPRSSTSSSRTSAAEPSPEIRRELFTIFFSEVQPWSCLVDEMSLLRDISSMTASPAMLFAIYALAAKHAFRSRSAEQRYARLVNEVGNGMHFAAQAHRVLHKEDIVTGLSILDCHLELESRQALCLLACFEFENRRYQRASQYLQHCCKDIVQAEVADGRQYGQQQKQLLKRVTSIASVLDICTAVTCGSSPLLRWWDIQSTIDSLKKPLTPLFSRHTGNRDEDINACLAHLLQIAMLFTKTMDTFRIAQHSLGTDVGGEIAHQIHASEEYLQQWAERLPARLRFDETNLQAVERSLLRARQDHHGEDDGEDQTHMSPFIALCWCAMHTFAESTTIALQRALGSGSLPLAAAQNLAMILERSNVSIFGGPLSTFGIVILRASCAAYECERHSLALRPSAYTDDVRAGAWSDVVSSTNRLQTDAGLVESQVKTAVNWLGFGVREDASRGRAARRAWTTSPDVKAADDVSMQFRFTSVQDFPKPSSRGSPSPVRSTASFDDAYSAPSLKSRHDSSASSTSGSVTSNNGVGQYTHHLPPLVGLSAISGSGRAHPSATSPLTKSANTLPPLRFASPDQAVYSRRKWTGLNTASTKGAEIDL